MPVYTTTLPNGQSIQVMGPSNATPEAIQQAALQIAAQRAPVISRDTGERNYSLGTAASKAFSRGTERLKSTFGDVIPAMVGGGLGFDEFAKRQMQEAQASEELIQRKYAPQIKSYKDVSGVGDALKFGVETVFEQIPNLGAMVVPGVAAGQVARIGAGKLAAAELAKRQAAAQGIGVYMGSYALNAPEVFQNIYQETGELATGTAVLFGAAAAALDSVLPSTILKNITPFEKSALAASVLRKSGTRPGITRSVLSGIAKGSSTEGVTEAAQEAISISAENFVAGNPQLFESEDWDRIMESAVRGAVAGGTFRGISEPLGRSPAEPKNVETSIKQDSTPSDLQEDAIKTAAVVDVAQENAKKNMEKTEEKPKAEEVLVEPKAEEVQTETEVETTSGIPYEGFRPPEGMTIEEGVDFYESLDEIDQMLYNSDVESAVEIIEQEGQDGRTVEDQIDVAEDGTEVVGSSAEILSRPAVEDAPGTGEPTGGEVGSDPSPVPTAGSGEGVVNPALEETVEESWSAMSDVPFVELSAENQAYVTQAKEDNTLTGEVVDQVEQNEIQNKKITAANARVKDATGVDYGGAEITLPKESRAEIKDTGETAETITTELVQEFGPNVNRMQERGKLVVVDNVEQLPADVKVSPNANGAYNPNTQTSYIIANRIEKGQGRRILLHEIGEHYGLERMVGKDYQAMLNRLKTLRKQNADVDAIFVEVQATYPELEVNSNPFLQEVMAKLGERAPNNTLFRRMVGAVKNFLRKLGLYDVNRFSDVDIQDMILNSLRVSLAEASSKSLASSTPAVQLSKKELKSVAGWLPERTTQLLKTLDNNNAASNYAKRGTYYVATMSPQQFLDLANPVLTSASQKLNLKALDDTINAKGIIKWVNQNDNDLRNPYNVPYLEFELSENLRGMPQIKEHEGRHRARALQRLGITQMPVLMIGPSRSVAPDNTDRRFPKRVAVPEMAGREFASQEYSRSLPIQIENIISIESKNEAAIRELIDFNVNSQVSPNIQFSREAPPGGVNPAQSRALLKYAGDLQQKLPLPTKDYIDGVWQKVLELPTSIKKAWTGMLGLQAMVDLYDKYLPSIKKLMNVLERRAAEVETTRAEVDVLGNLGMDIIQGKKRKLIVYDNKTGKVKIDSNGQIVFSDKTTDRTYTPEQIKNWEKITYKLSADNVDPRDPDNFANPDVIKFFNLPPELQALAIAYTEKFEQYGDSLLDAYKTAAQKAIKNDETAQEVVDRVIKEFTENRLKFYQPFRRRGDYVLSYVLEKDLNEHNEIMEQIENGTIRSTDDFVTNETAQEVVDRGDSLIDAYITELENKNNRIETSDAQKKLLKAKEFERYQKLVNTVRFETKAAYVEEAIKQDAAEGVTILKAEIDPENKSFRVSGEGAVGIMQEVTGILQKTDEKGNPLVDEAVIKEVAGLFLDALPSQSIKQQSRQRIGTGGYIEDIVGGFIDLGARMATQVANLKYIPEINETIADISKENAAYQADLDPAGVGSAELQTSLNSVVERLEDSKSFFHNPVAGPISSRFAYLSYLTSIAGNVSSALVNATQLAIIVYPTLVAEYGFGTANRVMGQAFKYYFGGGKDSNRGFLPDQSFGMKDGQLRTDLPKDIQRLYDEGIRNSVFRRGVGYELTEMRKTNAKDFVGTKAKFDALMGWMFQNTERMNREVTYLAGYLAAKEKGASFEVAEQKSRELTRRSHGTALPEIGPRFFQEGFGKVMFTFKRYGHAMLHLLFKAFNDAYRGETKEVKDIARKQILGIYGASFTFAGLQGAPLYGFTQALAEVMYAMFGDEDEPFDFEESTREIFGDIGYRGPLNKLLNVDIASRTGFANLIWREDPRRVSEVGLMQYVLEQGLGPSFSYGLSVNRGLQDMARGNIYRGIEQTLPAFARNPMKAIRYATEGAVNRKGAEIVPLNPLDGFLQIFGFTNEDLSLQYARNQSMKQAEKNFNARRSGLLTAYYLARKNGDFDMMREVQSKINDFNRSTIGRANPITGSTLKRSFKNREDSINSSVGGITLNKRIETAVRDEMGS